MKKLSLLALLVAFFATLSANAVTVYWDNTDTDWTDVYAYQFGSTEQETKLTAATVDGHELYAVEMVNGNTTVIFKKASGDAGWGNGNQTNDLPATDGAVYGKSSIKTSEGAGATTPIASIVDGKWVDNSTPDVISYALRGSFSGSDWYDVALTEADGVWSVSNLEVVNSDAAFGIKKEVNGGQTAWYSGNGSVTIDATTEITLVSKDGADISIAKGKYSFAFDPETLKLTVTLIEAGEPEDPNKPEPIYLRGGMNGWGTSEEWQLTPLTEDANIYKFTGQSIPANTKFKIGDKSWGSINYGVANEDDKVPFNEKYQLTHNGNDITLSEAWNGVLYFNLATGQVYMSNDKDAANPFVLALYVNKTGADDGWGYEKLVEGEATITVADNQTVMFTFTYDGAGFTGAWHPADSKDQTLSADGTYAATGNDGVYKLSKAGNYTVKPTNIAAKSFSISGFTTAVSTIESESAPVEFFNLNGVRVSEPSNGIFVRRQGSKVSKVVIR